MEEDTKKRVDYTPITQGLREYIERHPTMMHAVGLTDLLDNIDAIHRSLEDEYAEMRTFVESLDDAAKKHEDVDLWGTRYMALPLDADGVPICIGDVMKGEKVGGGFGEPFEVVGYMPLPLDADGVPIHVGDVMKGEKVGGGFGEPFEVVGYIMSNGELEPMDEHKLPRKRKYSHHHHHEPTVEDVLRELWDESHNDFLSYSPSDRDAIIMRFAKRLQLAEVEE